MKRLFMILLIIIIELLPVFYISYISFINLQIVTANFLKSDKAVTIYCKDQKMPSLYQLVNDYMDITIFTELYNRGGKQVWGILGNCDRYQSIEPILQGRFLEKEDFFCNKLKAVVGNNIIFKEDKNSFNFENHNYEIVGRLSSNISSMLDNTIFINLDSIGDYFQKFSIDSKNNKTMEELLKYLQNNYNVHIIDDNKTFIEQYIIGDSDKKVLKLLTILFVGILIIIFNIFIVRYYYEEIIVKVIIGLAFKKIYLSMIKEILLYIGIGTCITTIGYTIVYYVFNIQIRYHMLPIISIVFLITIILSLVLYIYTQLISQNFYKNGV